MGFHAESPSVKANTPMPRENILYLAADSHSLAPGWSSINVHGVRRTIQPCLVTGLKCWHMREVIRSLYLPLPSLFSLSPLFATLELTTPLKLNSPQNEFTTVTPLSLSLSPGHQVLPKVQPPERRPRRHPGRQPGDLHVRRNRLQGGHSPSC